MRLFEFTSMACCAIGLFCIAMQLGCDAANDVADSSGASPFERPPAVVAEPSGYEFETPVRLMADDEVISVEEPGYACPTMADVDGDGKLDLVVGQFNQGKMHFFKNVAEEGELPAFAKADWIKSGSDPAVVPGVW
jgi:hypothetical protein